MALNNYSNLKAAIIEWSHRDDITTLVDDFITIAEQEMYNNPTEPLIVREQEFRATADTTLDSRFLALPDRFNRIRRILIDDKSTTPDQYELRYYTPEVLPTISCSSMPQGFTITSQIEFNCPADAVYNVAMQYYAHHLPLDSTNSTNDVLTNYPNIYLQGALWATHRWSGDFEKAQIAYNDFIGAIRGANNADDLGRFGPASFMRIEGVVV